MTPFPEDLHEKTAAPVKSAAVAVRQYESLRWHCPNQVCGSKRMLTLSRAAPRVCSLHDRTKPPACQGRNVKSSPLVGCNIKCERTSPLFSGSFEPSAFIFFIPQTTINRNRNGVKTWREIIGIWILRIERRSRRGTPAGIARLKSPRDLACIPRRSTTNCNEAIPEKWTRRNARFTARSGRKRWFGKTSSAEAAVR